MAGPNVDSRTPAGSPPSARVKNVDTPTSAQASALRTTSSTVGADGRFHPAVDAYIRRSEVRSSIVVEWLGTLKSGV
jgi:hypothetical protein